MQRKKPEVDIINDILKLILESNPESTFVKSLSLQYEERGSLSKKQLQGLFGKASKVEGIPPAKLATLEAVILKKPNKYKSALPPVAPLYSPDEKTGKMIATILEKYPEHKRVLYFRARFENNQPLSSTDLADLERFHKLLSKT
jgi:hypothetical protein